MAEEVCERPHGELVDDPGLDAEEGGRKGRSEVVGKWRDAEEDGERLVVVEEATLVVCPMSVITSWEAQVRRAALSLSLGTCRVGKK